MRDISMISVKTKHVHFVESGDDNHNQPVVWPQKYYIYKARFPHIVTRQKSELGCTYSHVTSELKVVAITLC